MELQSEAPQIIASFRICMPMPWTFYGCLTCRLCCLLCRQLNSVLAYKKNTVLFLAYTCVWRDWVYSMPLVVRGISQPACWSCACADGQGQGSRRQAGAPDKPVGAHTAAGRGEIYGNVQTSRPALGINLLKRLGGLLVNSPCWAMLFEGGGDESSLFLKLDGSTFEKYLLLRSPNSRVGPIQLKIYYNFWKMRAIIIYLLIAPVDNHWASRPSTRFVRTYFSFSIIFLNAV